MEALAAVGGIVWTGGPPCIGGNRETIVVVSLIVQALDGRSFKKESY